MIWVQAVIEGATIGAIVATVFFIISRGGRR